MGPESGSTDIVFLKNCQGSGNWLAPQTIAPTTAKWTCPENNQLMWMDLVTPQEVKPKSVFPFLVKIGPGDVGSTANDAIHILIQPVVFTTLGQFGKAGYATTMNSQDIAMPNVFLSRDTETTSSADVLGEIRGIVSGSTVRFNATIADMDEDVTYGLNDDTRLIINIPKEWTFNSIISSNGFDPIPPPIPFPDGSTQIIGKLSSFMDGEPGVDEARTIQCDAIAPSVSSAKMYIMYILADGTATGLPAFGPGNYALGPLSESVLQVCPTSGCPP